ncbi:hypothetical protein FEM48_Zijuj01G0190200 [Ziziphus jujuba var. spinosa]|uniref:UBP-type domain-containing protein n=1 Tax=Ziziphus jujuba var. spinosa TaxID=714518 RepID=A0A978W304_ZIZJJ|nr:hypothetical protein FEM48_Zijuj01G0190200 [Ziziphus jujuba var. spinosa]
MFFLRVHSVDVNHPLRFENVEFTTKNASVAPSNPNNPSPKFSERRGVTHLFRSKSHSSLPNTGSRSTLIFVLAVPNYVSFEEFIQFCGSRIDHVIELIFIRNDGMEDRYNVLIRLMNQLTADGFYCSFNGKKFSPGEAEICHILFLLSVEYTESAELAGTPPDGCTELPTCTVCLGEVQTAYLFSPPQLACKLKWMLFHERLDPDTSGILSTLCDHSFQCPCVSKRTHLSCQVCRFCQQQDEKPTCSACGTLENPWICMICGFVGCGRYKEGHAVRHWKDTQHCYSLELSTQQIWDYVGDRYVHRLNQSKIDGKLGEMNSRCIPFGDCGSCACSEDSGISAALYSSKVETIVDEYNHLLASQLEGQRLVNRTLIKDQEICRKKFKEIEERETASLRLRDEKILDLEEQIRDLTVYIEAQKTLNDITDSDGIKGGSLLPIPSRQSPPSNTRRYTKSGRRRN